MPDLTPDEVLEAQIGYAQSFLPKDHPEAHVVGRPYWPHVRQLEALIASHRQLLACREALAELCARTDLPKMVWREVVKPTVYIAIKAAQDRARACLPEHEEPDHA